MHFRFGQGMALWCYTASPMCYWGGGLIHDTLRITRRRSSVPRVYVARDGRLIGGMQ
jgi:hypothetical protein